MGNLSLTKVAIIYKEKKIISSISGAQRTGQPCAKKEKEKKEKIKSEHFLRPYKKINLKWIKDLNVRPETIKLLEKNIGRTFDDINQSKILYDPPPRVMEIKTEIKKCDLIKLESFGTAKETTNKVKRQPSEWEKIIAKETTDKD